MKELGTKVEADPYRFGRRNVDAEKLGLQLPLLRELRIYFSLANFATLNLGISFFSFLLLLLFSFFLDESSLDKYYAASLDYEEQFIEGKIDQNKFEDIIREMFGIESYGIFTFDKLIHSIAKQVCCCFCCFCCRCSPKHLLILDPGV